MVLSPLTAFVQNSFCRHLRLQCLPRHPSCCAARGVVPPAHFMPLLFVRHAGSGSPITSCRCEPQERLGVMNTESPMPSACSFVPQPVPVLAANLTTLHPSLAL